MADWHMADWEGFIPTSPQGWAMMGKSDIRDEQHKPDTSDKKSESDK